MDAEIVSGLSATGSSDRRGDLLTIAIRGTDVFFFYQNNDLAYEWIINPPIGFPEEKIIGFKDGDFLPKEAADHLTEHKVLALKSGEPAFCSVSVATDDTTRVFDVWIYPDLNDANEPQGIVCTSVEKTAESQRERAMRGLLREVNHRSRNMLAIVSSLATNTARDHEQVDDFLRDFLGRLGSLATSQEVITAQDWRGAPLLDLIHPVIQKRTKAQRDRISVRGLNPLLTPNAATHVALAIHEMMANSVARGAMSRDDGDMHIDITGTDGGICLEWTEQVESGAINFNVPDFAFVTLKKAVPTAVGGEAEFSFDKRRINYRLFLPRASYDL